MIGEQELPKLKNLPPLLELLLVFIPADSPCLVVRVLLRNMSLLLDLRIEVLPLENFLLICPLNRNLTVTVIVMDTVNSLRELPRHDL